MEHKSKKVKLTGNPNASTTEFGKNNGSADILNVDCLINIFKFLPIADRVRIERVCKRWYIASQESWRGFNKLDCSQKSWGLKRDQIVTPVLKKVLSRCGEFIIRLKISERSWNHYWPKSINITTLMRMCPNLQIADLTGFKMNVPQLRFMSSHCKNITELSLGLVAKSCNDSILESIIFTKYKSLRLVKMVDNEYFDGRCLKSISTEFIEEIFLENCRNLRSTYLCDSVKTFPKLRTLSLRDSLERAYYSPFQIYEERNELFDCLAILNLRTLDISNNYYVVTDTYLLGLATACNALSSINLSYNGQVTDAGLASITALPNIEHLFIDGLTKVTDEVLMNMSNLSTLSCRGCCNLRDTGLAVLLSVSDNIELLDLTECEKISKNVVDAAITAVNSRSNGIHLKIILTWTRVRSREVPKSSPLLTLVFH